MRIYLLLLLLLYGSIVQAQQIHKNVPLSAYSRYVTFLPVDKLDSVLTYARTDLVPVIYKVNKYELQPNQQTDSIVRLVNQVYRDSLVRLAYVWIGGSASPEGPLSWNKKLGYYRSKALADYLLKHTRLDADQLRVENLVEDWDSVVEILSNLSDFPYRDEIMAIIVGEPDSEKRKSKIRLLDGGRTWRKLIHTVFPSLRNSRMVIVCHAGDTALPVSRPLSDLASEIVVPRKLPVPLFVPPQPDTRFWAVKTNTLFLAALVANAGIEVELWPRWSLDIPVWYSPYNITSTRKIRLLAVQPEVRHWFRKAGTGHFVGLHTHVVGFNVAVNDHGRYQDPNHALWGMGLSYGYAMDLGVKKRWGLEFNLGAGFAEYDYVAFSNWINGPKVGEGSNWYWGITRAGISISYKWYKNRKK